MDSPRFPRPMFIGHYAVALAAKRAAPKVSLGTTLCAAEFLDFVWPVLLLLGVEHFHIVPGITKVTPLDFYDYPYSHGLVFALGWSVLFAGAHFTLKRDKSAALVLGAVVFSHCVAAVGSVRSQLRATFSMALLRWLGSVKADTHGAARLGS